MPKHADGAGRKSYVLVLREHDGEGRGYSLELAPVASSGDRPPRARGTSSAREEEKAAAGTGTAQGSRAAAAAAATTATGMGTRSSAQGRSREEAAAATTTCTGTGSREGSREAAAAATATSVGTGSRARDDGEGGGIDSGCDDFAGAAGERILRDMRRLLFSPTQLEEIGDARPRMATEVPEIVIPVFLSPKKKDKNKDDIWNKRQIMYGIALVGLLAFAPAIAAFLPQWAFFAFATVWGFSSIGFPVGLFGTSRLETGYSRHMGRLVFMVFCLFVIFMLYQYMAMPSAPSAATPSSEYVASAPSAASPSSAHVDKLWTVGFVFVGIIVMAGHIISWVRGCMTGSDKDDESELSGEEDTVTPDLLQRLLERY